MTSLKAHLLAEIDAFQARHGLSDTYLARLAINQSRAIIGLRNGRSTISIDTADRLLDFMRGYGGRKRGAAHFLAGGDGAAGNGAVHGSPLNSSDRRRCAEIITATESKTSQATEAA